MSVPRWEKGEERELLSTRIFRVSKRPCWSPNRPDRVLDAALLRCPDWVNVIALTAGDEVVLIEQYRPGIDEVTLEIPGGMVDEGETAVEAAVRELREETGYAGGEARVIGTVTPNPAFQDNRCTTVLVRGCRRVGEIAGDEHEEIAVRLAPAREVPELLSTGAIHHALVVAAFGLAAATRALPLE